MKKKILLASMALGMSSVSRAAIEGALNKQESKGGEEDFDYHTKRNPDLQRVPYYRKSKREVYRKR